MKPGSNRRPRTRPNNNNNSNNKRQSGRSSYDSNGPDGKVRGTAQQVLEKYQALGRDATSAGDRVAAEAYFQFAEHYYRVVSADGGMQPPRREQHGGEASEAGITENEQVASSASDRAFLSVPDHEQLEEPPVVEVINVPIMPGPIAVTLSDEDSFVGNNDGSLGLHTKNTSSAEDDTDECKPKPVRRRRGKSKPIATETEDETRPIEV